MVPASSHKVPRVSWYSGYRLADSPFAYGAFTLSGWLSQNHSARFLESITRSVPQGARTLVWALPISLAATLEIDVSFFSSGYLDVSVRRVPSASLCVQHAVTEVRSAGFPHSDTPGSLDICSSPRLFAAYHVLLRLLVPRHPPYALFCMTFLACIALHAPVFCLSLSLRQLSRCLDVSLSLLYAVFKVHGLIITTVSPRAQNKVFRSRIFSEYPSASLQTSMLKQAWQGCLQAASAALIIIKWRIRDSNS